MVSHPIGSSELAGVPRFMRGYTISVPGKNGDTAYGMVTPSENSADMLGNSPASSISKKAADEMASRWKTRYGLDGRSDPRALAGIEHAGAASARMAKAAMVATAKARV
jgi:hypothetical protein